MRCWPSSRHPATFPLPYFQPCNAISSGLSRCPSIPNGRPLYVLQGRHTLAHAPFPTYLQCNLSCNGCSHLDILRPLHTCKHPTRSAGQKNKILAMRTTNDVLALGFQQCPALPVGDIVTGTHTSTTFCMLIPLTAPHIQCASIQPFGCLSRLVLLLRQVPGGPRYGGCT